MKHYRDLLLQMKKELDIWRHRSYPGKLAKRIEELETFINEEKVKVDAELGELMKELEAAKKNQRLTLVVLGMCVCWILWLLVNR